ncbi:MAG: hypothetical protein RL173_2447, partial [Fibrobacterota bacterium]
LPKMFNDYIRFQLDAKAAADYGLTGDKAKADRWASIVDRILGDKVNRDVLGTQQGFTDSAIQKWAAGQDSSVRKLSLDSLRTKGGRALALVGANLDSVYKANKESFKTDSVHYKPYDSVKTTVEDMFVNARQEKIRREFLPALRERYGIKLVPSVRPEPSEDTLKAYWKLNQERWSSQPIYTLIALGSKDSSKLAKALSTVKDAAAFKKLASKFPIGTPAAPEGVLGKVKQQFALPYGIGMVPGLFPVLETGKTGSVLSVVRANDSLFMATWMEAKDSGAVKPYAKVKSEVRSAWMEAVKWTPAPGTIQASWDKGTLFTRGDVDFISEEVPPQMRLNFPAERVLDFMINWKAYGRYARETGLDQRSDVKQTISDNEKIYWSQEFRQSSYAANFLFEKKHLDSLTTVWKDSLFKSMTVDSSKGANRDGARLALLTPGFLHRTYLLDIDKFRHDSTFEPYDSVRTRVYGDLRGSLDEKGRDRIDSVLKARYEFKLLPAAPQVAADLPFAAAFDSARANHDRRTLDMAEKLYHQVERDAKAPDSVRAQALFQLGQLYGEQQNYPRSLNAYRSVLLQFGKSNEAYKAQFMIAFTYSEYLKNEKAALSEYGKMLTNYPKSDLTDDADWMIRNIKSGGALMPKFDDSAFVADSIARADSLKKASAKSDTAKKVAPVAGAKTEAAKAPDAAKPAAAAKDSVKSKVAAKPVAAVKDSTKAKPSAAVAPKADTTKAKAVPPAAKDTAKAKAVKPSAAKADTAKAGAKK